jgi:nitrogen regulatory protein PII
MLPDSFESAFKEQVMKRISVVLKASEATMVRKAVCRAGGERVVVTPMTCRVRAAEIADWYCGAQPAACGDQLRLDVVTDDAHADAIVSAILATAHTGKIEQITRMPAKEMRVSHRLVKQAA